MGDAGIGQDEMVRELWFMVCRSTPSQPSLCDRMERVETRVVGIESRQNLDRKTGTQRFGDSVVSGAGAATGALIIAALLLGLALKLNVDPVFHPRQEVSRANP